MAEPFLAEIRIFAFNFAPRNWAKCDGQILPINQNQSLYSLLGTTYGGDGRTTFALPDLRGRSSIHEGPLDGDTPTYNLGSKAGTERQPLTVMQMPDHMHKMRGSSGDATLTSPADNVLADVQNVTGVEQYAQTGDVAMHPGNIGTTGGGGHENMQPYLVLSFCIAIIGTFPPRN